MEAKFIDFYNKKMLIVRILWGALLMSICMLGVVLFVINKEEFVMNLNPLLAAEEPMLIIFIGVALVLAAATFQGFEVYRNKIIKERWERGAFLNDLRGARGEHGEAAYSAAEMTYVASLDDRSLGVYRLHTRMIAANILRFALTEMIAILGFIAATQFANPSLFIPFGAVAVVLMLIYFPKSELNTQVI